MPRYDNFDAWFAMAKDLAPGVLTEPDSRWVDAYLGGMPPHEAVNSLPAPFAQRGGPNVAPALWPALGVQWLRGTLARRYGQKA